MDALQNLFYGFSIAIQPVNVLYCLLGTLIGTLIGVLPGIGPTATLSLLLPFTYHINPVSSLIMLSGIFMGANYGGSTTSILVNIPGEASSVVTCFDGYMMARKGRAGPALGMAAFSSFIAGTLCVFGLIFLTPILANVALKFGPTEYASLIIFSLTTLSFLARGSLRKALMMAALGLILGCVGSDYSTGKGRFVYGIPYILEGIELVPLLMGLFGVAEILANLEVIWKKEIYAKKIKGLLPNKHDWKTCIGAILRGTGIGFLTGLIPGVGGVVPTFVDYAIEKKLSKYPEKFGTGVIEGVAGPEATNNAVCQASFIPMFSLGIPSNAVMAVLMGVLMIHGLQPSPMMIKNSPDLFWGVVSSMYLANGMLLILNLPLIPIWVRILRVPYSHLAPLILLFCMIGSYSMRNSIGDTVVMTIFGVIGYLMRKFQYEPAPLIMAFLLGEMFEISVRQSLALFHGNPIAFIDRPITLGLLIGAALILASPLIMRRQKGDVQIKGKRVLILDDEQDVLDVLKELLEVCRVDSTLTAKDAIKLLEINQYDIAILDIMGVEGFKVLELTHLKGIPTLMLTANALSPENLKKSIESGASYYVPKEQMENIALFIQDIFEAKTKKLTPWAACFQRLGPLYDKIFGGPDWRRKEADFWEEKLKGISSF